MSTLDTLPEGSPITARVRKHHASNPSVIWWNTYEFRTLDVVVLSDYTALANRLANFDMMLSNNSAVVDQVTISTWAEDAHPYNPLSFLTIAYNLPGTRALAGEPVDLRVALYVRRQVDYGRTGKIFFRGSLSEGEISTSGGTYRLTSPGTVDSDVADALTASALETYIGDGANQFRMYMIGNSGASRPVSGLQAAGVAIVKLNHKYFDRA